MRSICLKGKSHRVGNSAATCSPITKRAIIICEKTATTIASKPKTHYLWWLWVWVGGRGMGHGGWGMGEGAWAPFTLYNSFRGWHCQDEMVSMTLKEMVHSQLIVKGTVAPQKPHVKCQLTVLEVDIVRQQIEIQWCTASWLSKAQLHLRTHIWNMSI